MLTAIHTANPWTRCFAGRGMENRDKTIIALGFALSTPTHYTLFSICDQGLGTLELEPFNLAVIKAPNAVKEFMGTRSIGLTFIR